MHRYIIHVQPDNRPYIRIETTASSLTAAIEQVMKSENCPRSAVIGQPKKNKKRK